MANLTITIPDNKVSKVLAAIERRDKTLTGTNAEKVQKFLRKRLIEMVYNDDKKAAKEAVEKDGL